MSVMKIEDVTEEPSSKMYNKTTSLKEVINITLLITKK